MTENNNRIFYIYKITNLINEKTYIGQRMCPKDVKFPDNDIKYMGSGVHLIRSQKKYGLENFTKEVIAVCSTKQEVDILEKQYIALYRSIGKAEYNITAGGQGTVGMDPWNKGKHGLYSEETIKKMSERRKGTKMSPDTIEKRTKSVKGYKTWTDGIHEMRCEDCPGEGWYQGRSESCKKASSESHKGIVTRGSKGMHWWNNGVENKSAFECPSEGWVPGRLPSYGESMKGKLKESNKGFHWWTNGEEDRMTKECPGEGWVLGRNNQEAIRKMSERQKGKTSNTKGTKWFTDGTVNVRAIECPPGFHPGRSEECRKRLSEGTQRSYDNGTHSRIGKNNGKHWCHNETEEKFAYECLEGWLPGRLPR